MKLRVGQSMLVVRVPHGHDAPDGFQPTDERPTKHMRYGKLHAKIETAPKKKRKRLRKKPNA